MLNLQPVTAIRAFASALAGHSESPQDGKGATIRLSEPSVQAAEELARMRGYPCDHYRVIL